MNALRPLLAVAVIFGAIFVGIRHGEHHTGKNAFETLYMHLMPGKLLTSDEALARHEAHEEHAGAEENAEHRNGAIAAQHATHGEASHDEHASDAHHATASELTDHPYLLAITLPGFPAVFDMHGAQEGTQLVATNLQLFQVAAVLLIFILFSGVPSYVRSGNGDWLTRRLTGFAMYIRDEMVEPAMGEADGRKFLPFFLCVFFFILFMNLMGLVPGSATATANIFVTGALALITLCSMVFCGMYAQGPLAFWKNLVPHVPLALWPLMFIVELLGLFVKPFALMIRLFANMTGGHLVVLSFMGLIFFFAGSMGSGAGYGVSPVAVGFAVFIMIIEVFVAMLQAYIFTQLSILFVGASVHPEH
ncbi:MAG: F0F1 ATP synthase subunit A [Planctomycetes bacterium]|nr:F0F1 ATP synthase subunit A [Planctomycetota bacterium]MCB9904208.1 F0F1 ATP synthase subunit A [Planctomycetota bacterium]